MKEIWFEFDIDHVWERSANHVSKKINFFLLKFNIIYML
jgi:hypothetical protein